MGSTRNPIDLTGDVSPAMLAACIDRLAESGEYDAVLPLVMGVPGSAEFGNAAYAAAVAPALGRARASGHVASVQWVMDEAEGAEIARVRELVHGLGVPVSLFPEDAVDVLANLVERGRSLARVVAPASPATPGGLAALRAAAGAGRTVLTEHASKAVLAAAGVPVVPSRLAADAAEAGAIAAEISYPVVVKLQSPDATHKSDLGGVALDLADAGAVRDAVARMTQAFGRHAPGGTLDGFSIQPMVREPGIELVCGVVEDAQFGKYLMVGLGGVAVEVLQDVSIRLLPVAESDVREMLAELKSYPLLTGHRGRPIIDIDAVARLVAAVARLAAAPEIAEVEINPILATAARAVAVDARIRLRDGSPAS